MPPDHGISPIPLFEMMHAYKLTSALKAGIELGIFDQLAAGPATAVSVAESLSLNPRGTRVLLNALTAAGLLEQAEPRSYRLTELSDKFLVRGHPRFLADMINVIASSWEWEAMDRLADAVRKGGSVVEENAETPEFGYWRTFAANAHAIAGPSAQAVAEVLSPWAAGRPELSVLDVACGHGLYGFAFAQRHEQAQIWSLDWPNVVDVALGHAARLGVADQVRGLPGDMFSTDLGGPHDLVLITNVLHHFSVERAEMLLRRAADATKPDGKVAVVGFVTDEDRSPVADRQAHMFALLMLAWTTEGDVHTVGTYRRMLGSVGFGDVTTHTVPGLPAHIMVATRSGQAS
ncbi:MAG: methyltransferase domain-containing protein [Actinomycetota bacterium]|nr:methyltransferase domain-containing protein [Actinomycetota bacterium]